MLIYRRTDDLIIGTVDGKPFNVTNTPENLVAIENFQLNDATYEVVKDYIRQRHTEEVAGSNPFLSYNPMTKQYFLKTEDGSKVSPHPIPNVLVKYIEDSYDKGVDFMPIVKAWARLLVNPRYNSEMAHYFNEYINTKYVDRDEIERLMEEHGYTREVAVALATYQDIAITKEGMLATYKVAEMVDWNYTMEWDDETQEYVSKKKKVDMNPPVIDSVTGEILKPATPKKPQYAEDIKYTPAIYKCGDRFYSGNVLGYVYEIGKMQHLPEKAKRNLNNTFGGGGLYIGGLNYIEGYHDPERTHVLLCFVDPADILSFQCDGHAIRVDALFPNNVWDDDVQLRSVYHSSDYATMSEERVKALIDAACSAGIEDLAKAQRTYEGDDAAEKPEPKIKL